MDKFTEIEGKPELSTQTQQEEGWKAGVRGDGAGRGGGARGSLASIVEEKKRKPKSSDPKKN